MWPLLVLLIAQGLPPNPEALPPRPDLRMVLDGRVLSPEQRNAERRSRTIHRKLRAVLQSDLQLTNEERKLIYAVMNAAMPEAFLDSKDAREKLAIAEREMRKRVSKRVIQAIDELDLSLSRPETPGWPGVR